MMQKNIIYSYLSILSLSVALVVVSQGAGTSRGGATVNGIDNNQTRKCDLPSMSRYIQRNNCMSEHEDEGPFDSSVHIARLELERVQIILIVTLFIIIVIIAKMVWHHKWMHPVASNIPESCMLIIVGAHIGGILISAFYLDPCNRDEEPPLRFTPDVFFLFLLPPIVLESGYFLDIRSFFENFTTIIVFAVVGTLWNAIAIGLTLYGLKNAGVVLTGPGLEEAIFSVSSALLFGTICSAVDPVAVLAVFDDIHVNKLLHILVFGESLLNDAVTIVLFNVLRAFSNRPFDMALPPEGRQSIPTDDVVVGVVQFFVVVLASFVIGVVVGMVAAFITRFSEHVHVLEPMIVFAMGYLSYILADMFQFSGIVSLIFCSITMKHYVEANISRKSSTTIKYSMKVLSNVSEMIIFLFLGLSLYENELHNWDWGLSMFSLLFALLYRPIGVIALTLIVNIFRFKKIGLKSVFVMTTYGVCVYNPCGYVMVLSLRSYSGLRGAVAFSLALARLRGESELLHPATCMVHYEAQLRKTMLSATTFLVLFTVFVQGITIKPLVKLIKVKKDDHRKPTLNEVLHGTTIDHVASGLEDIIGHLGYNRLREKIQEIDTKYLRRLFERYPEARDEQILHTWKRLQFQESQRAVEQNLEFKYHKDAEGRFGSHVSLHSMKEHLTPSGTPTPYGNPEILPEDCIPSINDILAASFANPHADHFGHVLSTTDREQEDHHFEPVSVRRDIIQSKHRARKNKKRRRRRLSNLIKASSERTMSDDQGLPGEQGTALQELSEAIARPSGFHVATEQSEDSGSEVRIVPAIETEV